jgi:hypothetical protein
VAQGEIDRVVNSDLLSETFGFALEVTKTGNRFSVRAK